VKLTYVYSVEQSVLDVFAEGKAAERTELLRIFQCLGNNPRQTGDYLQKTAA